MCVLVYIKAAKVKPQCAIPTMMTTAASMASSKSTIHSKVLVIKLQNYVLTTAFIMMVHGLAHFYSE